MTRYRVKTVEDWSDRLYRVFNSVVRLTRTHGRWARFGGRRYIIVPRG